MNKKLILQLLGIFSYALTQWLIILFLVHNYSLNDSASYIYYLAFFTPLSIFFSYGLRNGIASDKHYIYKFTDYKIVSYLGVFFYILFSLFLLNINDLNLSLLLFCLFLKLNEMISEPYYGNMLRQSLSHKYALSKIYKLIFGLIFFIPAYYCEIYLNIPYLSLFGYILGIYSIYFFYDSKIEGFNKGYTESNKKLTNLIKCNLPLAVSSFLIAFNSSVPKIIFGWEVQSFELAIFGFLIYFNSIALLPIAALIQIAFGKKNEINLKKFEIGIFVYSLIYLISFISFTPFILKYMYSVDYGYDLNSLFLAGLCGVIQFKIAYNNFILNLNRIFKASFYMSMIGLIFNLIFCYLFLDYGLNGILLAVMLSSIISLLFSSLYKYNIKRNLQDQIL